MILRFVKINNRAFLFGIGFFFDDKKKWEGEEVRWGEVRRQMLHYFWKTPNNGGADTRSISAGYLLEVISSDTNTNIAKSK